MLQSKTVNKGETSRTKGQDLSAGRSNRVGDNSVQRSRCRPRETRSPLQVMREKIRSLSNRTLQTPRSSERGLLTPRETSGLHESNHTGFELCFPWRREGHCGIWTPRSNLSHNATPRQQAELSGSGSARGSRRVIFPGSIPIASSPALADATNGNKSLSSSLYRSSGICRGLEEPLVQPQRVGSPAAISPPRCTSLAHPEKTPHRHIIYVDKLPISGVSENSNWRIFHSTVLTPRSPAKGNNNGNCSGSVTPRSSRRKSPIRPREYEDPSAPGEVTFKLNNADIQEIIESIPIDSMLLSMETPGRFVDGNGETPIQTHKYSHPSVASLCLSEPKTHAVFVPNSELNGEVQEVKGEEENGKNVVRPIPLFNHESMASPEVKAPSDSDSSTPHPCINGSRPRSESTATSTPRSDVAPSYVPVPNGDGSVKATPRSLQGLFLTPRGTQEKASNVPPSNAIDPEKSASNGKWKEQNREETSNDNNSVSRGSGILLAIGTEKKNVPMASELQTNGSAPRSVTFKAEQVPVSAVHSQKAGGNEVVVAENKFSPSKDIKPTSQGEKHSAQLYGTKLELTPPSSVQHECEETSEHCRSVTGESEFPLYGNTEKNKTSIPPELQTNGTTSRGVTLQKENGLPTLSDSHEVGTVNSDALLTQNNLGECRASIANKGSVETQEACFSSGWSRGVAPDGDTKEAPILLPSPDVIVLTLVGR
ncbi:hypothetical protein LSM04_002737 [Trypanosoma melophagium]|uniref:uncharacterized protein n=1 Tax=Trypanosoma melophagium TaxID=715481 RepID=UPI00351A5C43|nr:hypothetical protein LSM04_002737 [Trypanosoma melophagium]